MSVENETLKRREIALHLCESYTRAFEIPPISYENILAMKAAGKRVILIDVRSSAEQEVSHVQGAISKITFEGLGLATLDPESADMMNTHLVPYCTIGHRSGLFATQLRSTFAASWHNRIHNGQGVVPFSFEEGIEFISGGPAPAHALTSTSTSETEKTKESISTAVSLSVTRKIHVFGPSWDIANVSYTTVTFGWWQLLVQGVLHLFASA